jgi:rhamnosyltransferase
MSRDSGCSDGQILASMIILTKNGEKYLRSLLDALYCQKGIGQAEVIVIDSGSSDGTLAIVKDFPSVRLVEIPPSEFGHGKTRNLGARLARGEFLIYLPQDATPIGSDWLGRLLRSFGDPVVVGVYGRQVARVDASPMEAFFLSRTYHSHPEKRILEKGEAVSLTRCFFSTVGGAVRASTWAVHPFREDIIMSEDQAWASDVMRAGYAVAYEPEGAVWHSHQYGIVDIFRRNFDSGYSILQIFHGETEIRLLGALQGLVQEANFVATHSGLPDLLRFLPYELARHAGFWLGLHGDRLPLALCKAFSGLGYFWDQRKQRIGGAT